MRLVETNGEILAYQMHVREKALLLEVLRLYPLIPAAYPQISKADQPLGGAEHQKLLEEALADQRIELKKQVQSLVDDPQRFEPNATGVRFKLKASQREWLLQVLNDIRVGSWIILGSPEEIHRHHLEVTDQNAPYLLAMDACALFESALMGEAL